MIINTSPSPVISNLLRVPRRPHARYPRPGRKRTRPRHLCPARTTRCASSAVEFPPRIAQHRQRRVTLRRRDTTSAPARLVCARPPLFDSSIAAVVVDGLWLFPLSKIAPHQIFAGKKISLSAGSPPLYSLTFEMTVRGRLRASSIPKPRVHNIHTQPILFYRPAAWTPIYSSPEGNDPRRPTPKRLIMRGYWRPPTTPLPIPMSKPTSPTSSAVPSRSEGLSARQGHQRTPEAPRQSRQITPPCLTPLTAASIVLCHPVVLPCSRLVCRTSLVRDSSFLSRIDFS